MNATLHTRSLTATLAALALFGTSLHAQATPAVNMPVPASIHSLQAHEVVAHIIDQRHDLLLSDAQFAELQALHKAMMEERQIYESTGRSKPPYERPVWITTPEQALAKAFTILTAQQQHASLMLFEKAGK